MTRDHAATAATEATRGATRAAGAAAGPAGGRVVVVTEARFSRTPDGTVWIGSVPAYGFFQRYLNVFGEVRVVARVRDVARQPTRALPVTGPRVHVWPLPYYLGPAQYLRRWTALQRTIGDCVEPGDAVILRVPSPLGTMLAARLRRRGHPYALEVVGDPYDVFAPGVVSHPLRPALRTWAAGALRRQARHAAAVSYVTDRHLQSRYPTAPGTPTAAYSSVNLPPEAFVAGPRSAADSARPVGGGRHSPYTLISVGTLEQLYKGTDTVLAAVARLTADGVPVRFVHVGGGRYRFELERLADRLGIADRVEFTGELPAGPAVGAELDGADLFVLPSRAEALARALIEAMARGLPAVGSTVGGIPELLPPEYVVPPGDPAALATVIRDLLTDPARMAAASARNLARAHDFAAHLLAGRRDDFYRQVQAITSGHPVTSSGGGQPVAAAGGGEVAGGEAAGDGTGRAVESNRGS